MLYGRSRSSKVIDFGTNRNTYATSNYSVIETLVLSCTVSEILHVFVLITPPLFYPNFGGVPVGPDRPCWVQPSISLKLISREIVFEVFQPLWSRYLNVTDGRTDIVRQIGDILWHNRALRSIAS